MNEITATLRATDRDQGAPTIDTLLADLDDLAKRQQRERRNLHAKLALFTVALLGIFLATHEHNQIPIWIAAWSGSLTAGGTAIARVRRGTVAKLAEFDDVRAIGPLIDATRLESWETPEFSKLLRDALIRLLPRMQASDTPLLNATQRAVLVGKLDGFSVPLAIAILAAFEQVGDTDCLPAVEKLAAGCGLAAGNARVREAAEACLPLVREQIAKRAAAQTLLRAAAEPEAPPDKLLRPAMTPSSTPAEQLLRAREPGE